ncbi:MAG TPA: hypothetical protein VL284_13675 [Thermoanaerobaculia bacterium]|nr:hypothetical protein [Thermoanaerobaculia bacterium]
MRRLIFASLLLAVAARGATLHSMQAVHRVEIVDEDGMAGTRDEWDTFALQRREELDHAQTWERA